MSKFSSPVKLPPNTKQTTLKSEILWGCEEGGRSRFPNDLETIYTRLHSYNPRPLKAFGHAVMQAVERIWIVDEYFLVPDNRKCPDGRLSAILDWLHVGLIASDIRILTAHHDEITADDLELFKLQQELINSKRTRQPVLCNIEINTRLNQKFECIHDRFAIVDDELWHFGATVGGFHSKLSAASRGWDAEESGAIDFFKMVWDKCKG